MRTLILLTALLSIASAVDYFYGLHGCRAEPPRPRSGRQTCKWKPIKSPFNGCIVRWKCKAKRASPKPCPEAPAKPTEGKNCNWVTMRDRRGCVVDYECEPVTQPPCPRRPVRPDNTARCYYRAIKNNAGCVIDYVCEPLRPALIPIPQPIARPFIPQPAPIAHPFATFDMASAARLRAVQAQAAAANAATIRQAQFAASSNIFAPRIPILKDPTPTENVGQGPDPNANPRACPTGRFRPDEDIDCNYWSMTGQCQENPNYMLKSCGKSCKICE